jgi:hypothetical protein
MKSQTAALQKILNLLGAVFSGVLLIASAGCNCITINMAGPPTESHAGQPPNVSGGNFMPVQAGVKPPGIGVPTQICGEAVGRWVDLKPPSVQWTTTGDIGFSGYLFNVTRNQRLENSTFLLYYFVNTNVKGCCTNVLNDPNYVGVNVSPDLPYRFTVYFRPGQAPALQDQIQLMGNWTQ